MMDELWDALHHVSQLLLGRNPDDVAWWLRSNHPEYLADTAEHVREKINEMADRASERRRSAEVKKAVIAIMNGDYDDVTDDDDPE